MPCDLLYLSYIKLALLDLEVADECDKAETYRPGDNSKWHLRFNFNLSWELTFLENIQF